MEYKVVMLPTNSKKGLQETEYLLNAEAKEGWILHSISSQISNNSVAILQKG